MVLSSQTPGGCSGGVSGRIICMFAMVTYFALFYKMYSDKYNAVGQKKKEHEPKDATTKLDQVEKDKGKKED